MNPVLLYHSLGKTSKFNKIDHVNLETLNPSYHLLKSIGNLSLLMNMQTQKVKSIASVTIDDGYKNVIVESLKVFKNLNIPVTIFINSSTFDGKIFER